MFLLCHRMHRIVPAACSCTGFVLTVLSITANFCFRNIYLENCNELPLSVVRIKWKANCENLNRRRTLCCDIM